MDIRRKVFGAVMREGVGIKRYGCRFEAPFTRTFVDFGQLRIVMSFWGGGLLDICLTLYEIYLTYSLVSTNEIKTYTCRTIV
jgi:hypothetical protein